MRVHTAKTCRLRAGEFTALSTMTVAFTAPALAEPSRTARVWRVEPDIVYIKRLESLRCRYVAEMPFRSSVLCYTYIPNDRPHPTHETKFMPPLATLSAPDRMTWPPPLRLRLQSGAISLSPIPNGVRREKLSVSSPRQRQYAY